jgi:lyso-ornithine lipid O-acyltransferase
MKNFDDIVAAFCGALKAAIFLALTFSLIPVALAFRRMDPQHPFRIPVFYHRLLLKLMGIRVHVSGQPSTAAPILFVSNHASYLDVPILGSLVPAGFVAKTEVADWPLFGILSRIQNSVFVERRKTRAADQRTLLQDYLAKKQSLILFPEGTSSDGLTALPFKSSLFGIVEDSACGQSITVQPVSVTCTELDGFPMLREERPVFAWYGEDLPLVPHLWNVFLHSGFTVEVIFHTPLATTATPNRKDLAAASHKIVAEGIRQSLERQSCPV